MLTMTETGPNFSFEKGNVDMKVYKSENPISKEKIDSHILDFLYSKAEENSELLKISEFSLEFLVFKDIKGFFKFNVKFGNKNSVEVLLTGEDIKKVISLIQQYGSGLDLSPN